MGATGRVATLAVLALLTATPAARADLAHLVDPMVGTDRPAGAPGDRPAGLGATFPGAVLPFGMVQFSPDTSPGTENAAGGYGYDEHRLRGFSLTHFSGGGCATLQDVPILPTVARMHGSPVAPGSSDYAPRFVHSFSHAHEHAAPGSYGVVLDPGSRRRIVTGLTTTTHGAVGRFAFPSAHRASVLFNAGGSAKANGDAQVAVDPRHREITGSAESGRFCSEPNSYRVWFAARFDRRFAAYGTWRGPTLRPRTSRARDRSAAPAAIARFGPEQVSAARNGRGTAQAGAYASFDTRHSRAVEVRLGVSFTSAAEAKRNLRAEALNGSFSTLTRRARSAWNRALSHVRVSGGSATDKRLLYTSLYHALLHPNLVSDADARRPRYSNFSGWDVYRGQQQLLAMLFPGRASDMAQSLVASARATGCLPRWEMAGGQTSVMTGDPSDAVLASAYAFGARAFDARAALLWMVKGATTPCFSRRGNYTEREGLGDYLRQGYVGYEHSADGMEHEVVHRAPWGSAATTLEYEVSDYATSRLAATLGWPATARRLLARSHGWHDLYNPSTDEIEPRYSDGRWVAGYKPTSGAGFVEGDAPQYTWFVPHDASGLINLLGGPDATAQRLDRFFAQLNAGRNSRHAYIGNEPSLGVPWLYDWAGRPDRTQAVVRRAITTLFEPTPDGLPGNDDGGTLSAWWVFGALGMYPAVPGDDTLALASPLFKRTELSTGRGTVTITAPAAARGRPYVRSMELNGRPWTKPLLRFGQIARGARIRFDLVSAPARTAADPPRDPSGSRASPR